MSKLLQTLHKLKSFPLISKADITHAKARLNQPADASDLFECLVCDQLVNELPENIRSNFYESFIKLPMFRSNTLDALKIQGILLFFMDASCNPERSYPLTMSMLEKIETVDSSALNTQDETGQTLLHHLIRLAYSNNYENYRKALLLILGKIDKLDSSTLQIQEKGFQQTILSMLLGMANPSHIPLINAFLDKIEKLDKTTLGIGNFWGSTLLQEMTTIYFRNQDNASLNTCVAFICKAELDAEILACGSLRSPHSALSNIMDTPALVKAVLNQLPAREWRKVVYRVTSRGSLYDVITTHKSMYKREYFFLACQEYLESPNPKPGKWILESAGNGTGKSIVESAQQILRSPMPDIQVFEEFHATLDQLAPAVKQGTDGHLAIFLRKVEAGNMLPKEGISRDVAENINCCIS